MKLSIAICCHNSSKRIQKTLEHLQNQKDINSTEWEILLIDNASKDNTIEAAEKFWQKNPITQFKILQEKRLGLSYARERAFQEAAGEIVCFIDDDNWANPYWASNVIKIFQKNSAIGAIGGPILPVLEADAPFWFEKFKGNFTLWDLYPTAREVTHPICGAGLCIRKAAWEKLISQGFKQILTDRTGKSLSSGGDFEIGYGLLLNGWKLWYDPALTIQHFMPKERLNWSYLIRLQEGFGAQSITLEVYEKILKSSLDQTKLIPQRWWLESIKCLWRLARHAFKGAFPKHPSREGTFDAALFAEQYGRFVSILRKKNKYNQSFAKLQNAEWNIYKKISKPTTLI